jgi:hypothetical protein
MTNSNNSNYYPSATGETAAQTTARLLALKAENERLLAFVEEVVAINPYADVTDSANRLIDFCRTAAALLASVQATTAEDSEQ